MNDNMVIYIYLFIKRDKFDGIDNEAIMLRFQYMKMHRGRL